MSEFVRDAASSEVVKAIWTNLSEYYHYLGRSPAAELRNDRYLTWLFTGVPVSFLNAVLRADLPPDRVEQFISETLDCFRNKNATSLSWWPSPYSEPASLGDYLVTRGFVSGDGGPGMAAELSRLPQDMPNPEGLVVRQVVDEDALEQWSTVLCNGMALGGSEQRILNLYRPLGYELPLRSYIALLRGKPVATSQLFLASGVAGIYCVATVSEARGKGIGSAITFHALTEARGMGYHIAILHSSPMGYNVYRRLGFSEYCRMTRYFWNKT